MITYAEALAAIQALPARAASERVVLAHATARVLAEDVALARDQPSFDRATMDGYAVALPVPAAGTVRVVGTVAAGTTFAGTLANGEAVRIMTGAPCPAGTTVVPVEQTRALAGAAGAPELVQCDPSALVARRNIAWRAEDGAAGAVVLARGTLLTPALIAVAAMCGRSEVLVERAPRIAILTTGDELGAAGDAGICDSNGPYLESFAGVLGLPCTRAHVRDEQGALEAALVRARLASEVVVTSGGVSGSAADLVPATAARLGFRTVFHQVAMQPGKPVLLAAHADGQLLVGLPGNAVSVIATAHVVLLPALGRLGGGWSWRWSELPLARERAGGKRQQFLPARLVATGVEPVPWNGSGDLLAAAAGDGLVDIPAGVRLPAGAAVRFLPYVGGSAGGVVQLPPRAAR